MSVDVLDLQRAGGNVGEQPVEVEHALVSRQGLHVGHQGLHLVGRQRLEVVLRDLEIQRHDAVVHGDSVGPSILIVPSAGSLAPVG